MFTIFAFVHAFLWLLRVFFSLALCVCVCVSNFLLRPLQFMSALRVLINYIDKIIHFLRRTVLTWTGKSKSEWNRVPELGVHFFEQRTMALVSSLRCSWIVGGCERTNASAIIFISTANVSTWNIGAVYHVLTSNVPAIEPSILSSIFTF